MMGGNHRPSAPFCRELLTLAQFVMRYFVPGGRPLFLGEFCRINREKHGPDWKTILAEENGPSTQGTGLF
jgi:hypothetical protein